MAGIHLSSYILGGTNWGYFVWKWEESSRQRMYPVQITEPREIATGD
jgi:hypothetical protein